jgi:hypothetical protein
MLKGVVATHSNQKVIEGYSAFSATLTHSAVLIIIIQVGVFWMLFIIRLFPCRQLALVILFPVWSRLIDTPLIFEMILHVLKLL